MSLCTISQWFCDLCEAEIDINELTVVDMNWKVGNPYSVDRAVESRHFHICPKCRIALDTKREIAQGNNKRLKNAQ